MHTTIVQEGFDAIAHLVQSDRDAFDNRRELVEFARLLPPRGHILDAGCGVGIPAAKFLADGGYDVTGVDISTRMLELAKKNVPAAKFVQGDMTQLQFKPKSFDGIVSLHAIVHIPREKHEDVLRLFHKLLKHEGVLMISSAAEEWEGMKEHYGVPMYWSHHAPEKMAEMVRASGFTIVSDYHVESPPTRPDEKGKVHYWIIARNWEEA